MKAHSQAPSELSVVTGDSVIDEQGSDEENNVGPGRMHRSASRPNKSYAPEKSNIMGPTYTQRQRRGKRRKDTRPGTAVAERRIDDTTANAEQEEPGQIGNIGWYFGNWGLLSKKDPINTADGKRALEMKHRIKQNPGHVLGLSECEAHTEQQSCSLGSSGFGPIGCSAPQQEKRL